MISTYSVGFDHIDTEFAKKRKIRVGYTPEVLTDATADLAFTLLLDILRRVSEGDRVIRLGKWKIQSTVQMIMLAWIFKRKLWESWGLGRIGKTLAKRARGI